MVPARPARHTSQIAELQLSPELELLLTCARRDLSAESVQRARELRDQPLDWDRLIEQAQLHGLLPLLHWHGTRSIALDCPQEIGQRLEDRFRANVARSLLMAQELFKIVELLGSCGIPVVPFKGPVLAESLYGDAALRECVDLDILLRARDVPEAIRVLVSAGYDAPKKLDANQQNAFVATQYEYPLLTPVGTLVELQWRIVPRYFSLALPEELYWSRLESLTICGRETKSLSCEDLLLLLSFHGSKHGWERLIWLADVGELVASKPHLDWVYVLEQARRAGGLRMVLLAALLANRLLGTPMPSVLGQPLARERTVARIANSVCRNLVSGEEPSYTKSQLYLLSLRERWQDRLGYVVRFTCTATPKEWELIGFPPHLSFLYVFLRLLRGLRKALSLARNTAARVMEGKV